MFLRTLFKPLSKLIHRSQRKTIKRQESWFWTSLSEEATILEIGPFCNPRAPTKGGHTKYLDVFSTDELRSRAADPQFVECTEMTRHLPDSVPEIDFIWKGERYSEIIDEKFDAVFSSHNIEHQTNIIHHLEDVASILNPEGKFYIIIPDKRYCYDHFRPLSTLADVIDSRHNLSGRHSLRSLVESILFKTHNDIRRHWAGDHGENPFEKLHDNPLGPIKAVSSLLSDIEIDDGYRDVHAWCFTPDSFANLARQLRALELSNFYLDDLIPTQLNRNEFLAILKLNK